MVSWAARRAPFLSSDWRATLRAVVVVLGHVQARAPRKDTREPLHGPLPQASFGAPSTRFVFVMAIRSSGRSPLRNGFSPTLSSCALWGPNIAFWFDTMTRAIESMPQLHDAMLIQLESASASIDMQLGIARHLLCSAIATATGRTAQRFASTPTDARDPFEQHRLRDVLAEWDGVQIILRRCIMRKAFRDPAFRHPAEHLASGAMAPRRSHASVRRRRTSSATASSPLSPWPRCRHRRCCACGSPRTHHWLGPATRHGALTMLFGIGPSALGGLSVKPRGKRCDPLQRLRMLHRSFRSARYHRRVSQDGRRHGQSSGMDIRMNQIVSGLVAMRFAVHFVCHCDMHPSQLSPFEPSVVIYMRTLGSSSSRRWLPPRPCVLSSSSIRRSRCTHQRMLNGEDWHLEPTSQLPEEQVLEMVHAGSMKGERTCTYAVADDVTSVLSRSWVAMT